MHFPGPWRGVGFGFAPKATIRHLPMKRVCHRLRHGGARLSFRVHCAGADWFGSNEAARLTVGAPRLPLVIKRKTAGTTAPNGAQVAGAALNLSYRISEGETPLTG